jgi:hypothetical protein
MGPVAGASTRGSSRGSQAPLYASHVSTTSSSPERTVIAGGSFGSSTVVNESRPRRFIVLSPHLSPHSLPHRGALGVQPLPKRLDLRVQKFGSLTPIATTTAFTLDV